MYREHFGLREQPFSLTPDTTYCFEHASHREGLNVLRTALHEGEGFIKVIGEVGLGKTLLCRKLLNELEEEYVTAYVPNPHLSPTSIRLALASELGIDIRTVRMQEQLMRLITNRLLALAADGKRVVLCLDEAQQLPQPTFEAIRLLTNLETEKRRLLQVVLFGQPELDERLADPAIRQLRQRITFSYTLRPLTRAATGSYVRHRLRTAGYSGSPLFADRAVDRVHAASRGTPRLINVLCHKALLAAYGDGAERVSPRHVRRAIADTDAAAPAWVRAWDSPAFAATLLAVSGGSVLWLGSRYLGGLLL